MKTEIRNMIITFLSGMICCVLVGLIVYGAGFFKSQYMILFGLYGAVFYSVLTYRNNKEKVLIAVVIFIFDFIYQGKGMSAVFFVRDILFLSSLLGSVYLYKAFINKNRTLPLFARSFVLPLFLGITNTLAVVIIILLFHPSSFKIDSGLFLNAKVAALVGIGLGIGFDISEKIINKTTEKLAV